MKRLFFISTLFFITVVLFMPFEAKAFVIQWEYTSYEPAGFFQGIWHGMLAPWSLIARWFIDDISMYAFHNTGWFYDFGFLMGTGVSLPIGWAAAIISTILHFI